MPLSLFKSICLETAGNGVIYGLRHPVIIGMDIIEPYEIMLDVKKGEVQEVPSNNGNLIAVNSRRRAI